MTTSPYAINDTSGIFSPALLFFKDLIRANLARMVELAGSGDKLRPHVTTHTPREIVRLAQAAGIHKAKCSTLAEAEMVASCGVADILLAYPMVGPNVGRLARLLRAYPAVTFSVLTDHSQPVAA